MPETRHKTSSKRSSRPSEWLGTFSLIFYPPQTVTSHEAPLGIAPSVGQLELVLQGPDPRADGGCRGPSCVLDGASAVMGQAVVVALAVARVETIPVGASGSGPCKIEKKSSSREPGLSLKTISEPPRLLSSSYALI